MTNKNLAIIGASYLQLPLIEKAKEMGYVTHVFAWAANDIGEEAADFFHPISIIEKEKILRVCQEINICGICSIASDVAVITVNYVAEKLGLVGNSNDSTKKCTDKYLMRTAFKQNGDPSPKSVLVDGTTNLSKLEIHYPVIVKPTDRSGSRGVIKVDDELDLEGAVKAALAVSFSNKVLIEEYVEGQEYSVEYISYKGKHFFLALTLKRTTGEPCFIETGHLQPAPVDDHILYHIKSVTEHALNTLGIEYGASHTEIKVDSDGSVNLIEVGARMGGDCIGSDLVYYSTGYDYVKMVINVACGEKPDFTCLCEPAEVESCFIFEQKDIDELDRLKREEPDKLLKIVDYHPENIGHITDSSNRAGCYIRKV